jgi:hypothetical protein
LVRFQFGPPSEKVPHRPTEGADPLRLPRVGAIWAIAHKLCRIVWKILDDRVCSIERGQESFPRAKKPRAKKQRAKKLVSSATQNGLGRPNHFPPPGDWIAGDFPGSGQPTVLQSFFNGC